MSLKNDFINVFPLASSLPNNLIPHNQSGTYKAYDRIYLKYFESHKDSLWECFGFFGFFPPLQWIRCGVSKTSVGVHVIQEQKSRVIAREQFQSSFRAGKWRSTNAPRKKSQLEAAS